MDHLTIHIIVVINTGQVGPCSISCNLWIKGAKTVFTLVGDFKFDFIWEEIWAALVFSVNYTEETKDMNS